MIKISEKANFILTATTDDISGNWNVNSCGLSYAHSYGILAAFELLGPNKEFVDECLLMRNPWGWHTYSGKWNQTYDEIQNKT